MSASWAPMARRSRPHIRCLAWTRMMRLLRRHLPCSALMAMSPLSAEQEQLELALGQGMYRRHRRQSHL